MSQYKDVMQAAERFFEGKFDHIKDEDVEMSSEYKPLRPTVRLKPSTRRGHSEHRKI